MTKPPLRIAAVGSGYFSQFHYDAWERLGVEIVGVCSLELAGAKAVSDRFDGCQSFANFEQMLDSVKPELVDIIVPPENHLKFVNAAVQRGIPMICQKPFTRSITEAEQAVDIAQKSNVLLVVHENFRFQPWHLKIKNMINGGVIGEPYQVSFRMRPGDGQGPDAYLNRQPYFQKMERFLVHETAIHIIDVFRFMFGEISNVVADLARLNPNIAGEDAGLIIFNFENGVRGLFDGNRLSDHIAKDRRFTIGDMYVEGSKGTIRLDGDGNIYFRSFGKNDEVKVDYEWSDRGFAGDSVYLFQKHVIDYLESGGSISNTAQVYIANLRIEKAIYKSHEEGVRVNLD